MKMADTETKIANLEKLDAHQFVLSGELTMQTVPTVARDSQALIDKMHGDVKINLAKVKRADSAGLALLIDWLRQAQSKNIKLEFEHLPEQLMQIAKLSELHELLPIHKS